MTGSTSLSETRSVWINKTCSHGGSQVGITLTDSVNEWIPQHLLLTQLRPECLIIFDSMFMDGLCVCRSWDNYTALKEIVINFIVKNAAIKKTTVVKIKISLCEWCYWSKTNSRYYYTLSPLQLIIMMKQFNYSILGTYYHNVLWYVLDCYTLG